MSQRARMARPLPVGWLGSLWNMPDHSGGRLGEKVSHVSWRRRILMCCCFAARRRGKNCY